MARKPRAEFEITAQDKSAATLRQAEQSLNAVAGNVKNFAIGAGVALTAAGVAIGKMTADLDKLAKTAKAAGVGVETFQSWQFAATQSGVTVEQFAVAMVRANRAVGEVASGVGPAVEVFNRLGIAARDVNGNVRSTEDVIRDFAVGLAKLPSSAERAATAAKLFGEEAGPKMALLLKDGEAGLLAFEDTARRLGLVVSKEATENAERFSDQLDVLGRVAKTALYEGLAELLPAISTITQGFIDATPAIRDFASAISLLIGNGEIQQLNRRAIELDNTIKRTRETIREIENPSFGTTAINEGIGVALVEQIFGPFTSANEAKLAELREVVRQAEEELSATFQRILELERQGESGPPSVAPAAPAGLTNEQAQRIVDQEEQAIRLRMQFAKELTSAIEAETRERAERELLIWQEQLAQAAGFETVAAQEAFARDEQLFLARMEARARQFEEELAVELGYKDVRDMAIQQAEEAHQDALLQARTRQFGQFQKLAMDLANFEKKSATEKTQFILQQAAQLTAGLAANNKTLFNINKAVAIANATVNTAEGVTKALASANFGLAALIAATGAAQIATIASTQFGGSSSGLTSSGPGTGIPSLANDLFTPPVVSERERNESNIRLIIQADDSEIARAIFKQARQVADDEDDLLFSQRSRQAIEIG